MRLARVQAILPVATADGAWHQKGSVFVVPLSEELRIRQMVVRLEIFDSPEPPPPAPPKAGTAADDAPPNHRMQTRLNRRDA